MLEAITGLGDLPEEETEETLLRKASLPNHT